ncbi:hypothetical protein GWR56_02145 [Mucilaginibacter sp. 14171R-50]|uniref:DKNYY domain-containing protein n=1 Tax=Mucilaginibacter sp. 14171R-50 TaxID=2703789 RepID=UPI00138D73C8|nr:DKNYY domain-containing protein [Mucilaginibacter sp. 14171R-50]QHS54398.1 hypothetical protein GWR56_02145 [Mucilaginibacter sp. 14171R-50]
MLKKISIGCLSVLLLLMGCNKYEKRNGKVFYNSWNEGTGHSTKELTGVNVNKFHVLGFSSYAKDDKYVFYNGARIKNADAITFQAIGDYYAHDKDRGYYGADSITSSQGRTFRIINNYYTTDGTDIFFMQKPLKVSSTKSFRFVFKYGEDEWERWTTDGKYYYYKNYKVPSSDYKRMTLYKRSGGLSKDSRWVYFLDHKLNFDVNGIKTVDTIDIATFEVLGYIKCKDKFGCFNVFHGRTPCDKLR